MLKASLLSLSRRPLLAAGIIGTLALAFAATLLVSGLFESYLLRPLPFRDASRLVEINEYAPSLGPANRWRLTFANAADIHDRVRAFSRTAIVRNEAFVVRAASGNEVAFLQQVTPEFFSLLGIPALVGDVITPVNAEVAGQRALVLSYDYWQRRFGGDRAVIGQSVQLDHWNCRIVGVLPAGVVLPAIGTGQQGWMAMLPTDFQRQERSVRRHFMFGELAPGRSLGSALGELAALAATLQKDFPATNGDRSFTAVSLRDSLVGSFGRQLVLLQAAVVLVLAVAAVNAGCLLLAQAIRRRREFAVRLSLGAATGDLFRQFFLESLWLTTGGAGLGLALAAWIAPLTGLLLPAGSPLRQLPPPAVGVPILGLALLLALALALLFSLVPLWQARRLNLEATLRDGARQIGSAAGSAATRLLISFQVALALALLITAVQLVRSFQAVREIDYGLPIGQLYTFRLGTRGAAYGDAEARVRFFDEVAARLAQLPHVAASGAADYALPAVPSSYFGFIQEGDTVPLAETAKRAVRRAVSVDLFDALQLKLIAGRWLAATDRAATPHVAVVSQSLADKYWPGQNALGRRVQIDGLAGWWEIVGVVSDVRSHGTQPQVIDTIYFPHTQWTPNDTAILVRLRGTSPLRREQVDRIVSALEPTTSAYAFQSVGDFFADSSWQTRFSLTLVGAFAALAVALSLTGIYAVLAFSVAGRTAEFGVRLALGASRQHVAALVLQDALRMTVPGLLMGTLFATFATQSITHLLYGVAAVDLTGYLITLVALTAACLLASLLPCWRAARVDPLVALRAE